MPTTSLAERMLLVVVHSQTNEANRTRGNFMASPTKEIKKPRPQPNSDFYQLLETLPADELAVVKQVRTFMETKVAPIITKYWIEDSFPFELLPVIKELNIAGVGMNGYGCRGGSAQLFGLVDMG